MLICSGLPPPPPRKKEAGWMGPLKQSCESILIVEQTRYMFPFPKEMMTK